MDGSFSWAQVPGYIICQMLGGIFGGVLVWLMYLPHWKATEDQGAKLVYSLQHLQLRIILQTF